MPTTTDRTVEDEVQLVSVAEVARALALSRSAIYTLMNRGELAFVKLGKSRRVRWTDVLRLVETNLVSRE